ncbi:MAG TPA: DPP IV N-terminal domain-containing protein [Solirubrobacteraceae bacterium]|nr:DPP IV N-terminal domain-containing protein [Solirubrobacteraceae bacterium]
MLAFVVAGPSGAAFPGTNGKIAFRFTSGGNVDVYSMNADGSGLADLTNDGAGNGQPSYSADGSKLVFYSDRDGNREIYSMNADGSDQVNLTHNSNFDGDPAPSPDGRQIAFITNRSGPNVLWLMNADGSGQHVLSTANWDTTCFSGFPRWSPDGSKIVFQQEAGCTGTSGDHDILVANADGSGTPTDLTSGSTDDETAPDWSPDGTKIAYARGSDIWVMNADGSNKTQLTTGGSYPRWSPDGTQVIYDAGGGIYRIGATGGTPQPVYVPGAGAGADVPDWQPIRAQPTTTTTTTTSAPPPPPAPAPTGVAIGAAKVTGTALAASIVCKGPAGASPCSVLATLTTVLHVRGTRPVGVSARVRLRKRVLKLAQSTLSVPAGATAPLRLALGRTGKALLKRFHTLPARLTVTLANAASGRPAASKKVVFRAPRKKKH